MESGCWDPAGHPPQANRLRDPRPTPARTPKPSKSSRGTEAALLALKGVRPSAQVHARRAGPGASPSCTARDRGSDQWADPGPNPESVSPQQATEGL